jgi:hypothetical protein
METLLVLSVFFLTLGLARLIVINLLTPKEDKRKF